MLIPEIKLTNQKPGKRTYIADVPDQEIGEALDLIIKKLYDLAGGVGCKANGDKAELLVRVSYDPVRKGFFQMVWRISLSREHNR